MSNTIEMYNGKVWGNEVSEYAKENGRLDYQTLACMVGDLVLNNNIIGLTSMAGIGDWYVANGSDDGDEIYQYYIIADHGLNTLQNFTDELVYCNDELDMNVWCITHYRTSWEYVLTDIELLEA